MMILEKSGEDEVYIRRRLIKKKKWLQQKLEFYDE